MVITRNERHYNHEIQYGDVIYAIGEKSTTGPLEAERETEAPDEVIVLYIAAYRRREGCRYGNH